MKDPAAVPWRHGRGSGMETLLFTSGGDRDDIPTGNMATAEIAEKVAAEHNAELLRRKTEARVSDIARRSA